MTLDELRNLDPAEYGSWPLPVKLACCVLLMIGVLFGFWHFAVQGKRDELKTVRQEEVALRQTFEDKQKLAASLPQLKEQLAQIEESFGDLLRQLPDKAEIESLLVDISQKGLSAGLEFNLFKPGKEAETEFYAELPIEIEVVGAYHQFGEFISGISSLPRIVTTHAIDIKNSSAKGQLRLNMSLVAKTYRAVVTEEEEAEGGSG